MPVRHKEPKRPGLARRWLMGATVLTLAAAAAGAGLVASTAAEAAPNPSYHAGSDDATFTVTGVLDGNCLVSVGGTEIWIKPGDDINFDSSLVGIDIAKVHLVLGTIAGLNITAVIDAGTDHAQKVSVVSGKKVAFPSSKQTALGAGDHKITWQATGLGLLGGLASIPLNVDALKSGASLEWTGVIHVTKDAPKCKLGVSTPKTTIKVGPKIKVTVPQIDANIPGVTLPDKLPSVGDLVPGKTTTKPATSNPDKSKPNDGSIHYTPPGLTIPDQVVPHGSGGTASGGDGGFYSGALPGTGAIGNLSPILGDTSKTTGEQVDSNLAPQKSNGKHKTIDLAASNQSPSGALPVVLAIVAILALALVAGTYARLYLLRNES